MNDATTMTCICNTPHTFPAGVGTGTCAGCGLGLILSEEVGLDAPIGITDDEAVQSPDLLVMKIKLLLERGDDGRDAAVALVSKALDEARAEGREYADEGRGGRDPAEDGEPDISDEGFDPYEGQYTDDC